MLPPPNTRSGASAEDPPEPTLTDTPTETPTDTPTETPSPTPTAAPTLLANGCYLVTLDVGQAQYTVATGESFAPSFQYCDSSTPAAEMS